MLRIIADSTCDISKEDARKMGIQIVPISVRFGNEEFLDGVEITHEEFYTRLAECDELPKTSQPIPDTFMKVFNEAVAAGDDVLGIFISSDLEEVERVSDRVVIMKEGKIVKELQDDEITIDKINYYSLNG